jgi:hypothetical protein
VNEIYSSGDEFFMDSFGDREDSDKKSITNFVNDKENEQQINNFIGPAIVGYTLFFLFFFFLFYCSLC